MTTAYMDAQGQRACTANLAMERSLEPVSIVADVVIETKANAEPNEHGGQIQQIQCQE